MTQDLLDRLVPAVMNYETDQFRLSEDLHCLSTVRRAGAPAAVILYAARILEALAADALKVVPLEPSSNVFANLDVLQQYSLIPHATCYWAHALRRIGNSVRHIRCRAMPCDAELAALFAERWLEWFFREFRIGHRLPAVTRDGKSLGLSDNAELRDLMVALENPDRNLKLVVRQFESEFSDPFQLTPTIRAVLAEMLLEQGEHDDACVILDTALAKFPDDLRLRQLKGLYLSRTGQLSEALEGLEPLYKQFKDDDETAGIVAGVYKRSWLKNQNNLALLEKAQRAYRQGWERSKRTNAYLGINAATSSLWLGQPLESRTVAEEVRKLLQARAAALAKHRDDPGLELNYWDQVTLAEAELLVGELAAAKRNYCLAFDRHHKQQRANIAVSCNQLEQCLRSLGHSLSAAEFLGR